MAFSSAPPPRPCVVPGGGLSPDGQRWVCCRPGFFLPVRVLSCLFRRLFLESLQKAFDAGKLQFFGALDSLREVLPAVSPAPKTPNGWSTPSGPLRARAGARLCGPLYPPRGPLQQPAAGYRKRSGPFPAERLSGGRPDQNDDFIGRRVHPAVLTARVAERLPTHSLLRLSGKSLPATETCPVSPLTRHADAKPRQRCHAGKGLPRPLRAPHQLFVAAVSAMLARRHPAKIREIALPCSDHHLEHLANANNDANPDLMRLALKLATGAGVVHSVHQFPAGERGHAPG